MQLTSFIIGGAACDTAALLVIADSAPRPALGGIPVLLIVMRYSKLIVFVDTVRQLGRLPETLLDTTA